MLRSAHMMSAFMSLVPAGTSTRLVTSNVCRMKTFSRPTIFRRTLSTPPPTTTTTTTTSTRLVLQQLQHHHLRRLPARYQSSSSSTSSSTSSSLATAFRWLRHNVTITNIKTYWPQFLAGTGALIVLYGISSASVHIATVLLELDMKQVFYIGFLTGVGTSLAMILGGYRGYRLITIAPDQVYRLALHKLARNSMVRAELGGGSIKSGNLKAYVIHPGHFNVEKGLKWVEPRVQMLFQIVGANNYNKSGGGSSSPPEGMVTAEAVKHKGGIVFTLLAVDTLPSPPPNAKKSVLLLVAGKEEKLHVRGTLRGFLQTERAQYVEQDVTETDDDRVSEQQELPEEVITPSTTALSTESSSSSSAAAAETEGKGSGEEKEGGVERGAERQR